MSKVSTSKVYIAKCDSYGADLEKSVFELLDQVLKDSGLLSPGKRVLIKPNLLTDRTPEEAVTTHPEVVRCIIRYLKPLNVEIAVADSPASAVKVQRVWETTGFAKLCKDEDVPLLSLEESGSETITSNGHTFSIAKPVMDADVVISVPKVKTHTLTMLTAAVKNYYGTLPGYQKANMHMAYPKPASFGKYVRELYRQMPTNINIADAVVGMEGNGPSGGTPAELGFLAASIDAVALDLTLCKVLGIKPASVPYLNEKSDGDKDINILGAEIDAVRPSSFKLPSTLAARLIPKWLVDLLDPFIWVRPTILDNCIGCSRCVKACPADALTIDQETVKAVLSPKDCISCCCCHEVCPEKAIEMRQSPMISFLRKGKKL